MEVIKRNRLATIKQSKFEIEFADFMTVDLNSYAEIFPHKRIEKKEDKLNYGTAQPLQNIKDLIMGKIYDIDDEIPGDRDNPEGYILLKTENKYTAFYPKQYFKLKQ